MRTRDLVLSYYPQAEAVEEVLPMRHFPPIHRCCWFVYDGPDLDARVLGRGTTEDRAWADAVHRLSHARATTRVMLAG